MKYHQFEHAKALDECLANKIAQNLSQAIQERDKAYLVVSGGKTPLNLFEALAQTDLPWEKVTIILADERCVSPEHEDSNERMVKQHLLQKNAKASQWMSLHSEPLDSLEPKIASLPEFDVVLLGLGEDGHTASLFPCSQELEQALSEDSPALVFVNPQKAPYQRLSLSKKRLLQSRAIFLHFTGQNKQKVLEKAMAEKNPLNLPIAAFLNAAQLEVMYAPSSS